MWLNTIKWLTVAGRLAKIPPSARGRALGERSALLVLPDAHPIDAHLLRVEARIGRFGKPTDGQR